MTVIKRKKLNKQKGFSLPELIVVLLIIAILVVLALPQLISSRRALRFSGVQRLTAATLSDARQEAMSQRTPVTVRYSDATKKIVVHGGSFGAAGDAKNRSVELTGSGLQQNELVYGQPSGAPSTLADSAAITSLTAGEVAITFQADGSVIDGANNPRNNALFFHNSNYPDDMAFAISVLGAGGRVKIWRYNKNTNSYVE
jgi:prepilin-type N-terminal cleavage/methylation domain-containing protein